MLFTRQQNMQLQIPTFLCLKILAPMTFANVISFSNYTLDKQIRIAGICEVCQ